MPEWLAPHHASWLQLEDMRKNEDPRLSFSTPEFKEAQRIFTDGFKVSEQAPLRFRRPQPLRGRPLGAHNLDTREFAYSRILLLYVLLYPQKNFGKPVEWALVKDHAWSTPQLRKLDKPVSAVGGGRARVSSRPRFQA